MVQTVDDGGERDHELMALLVDIASEERPQRRIDAEQTLVE
jgi:hypothetical protein